MSPSTITQAHACAPENEQWSARFIAPENLPGTLAQSFDLLQLHRLNGARYPHILESAARGGVQARFDILFAFPGDTLTLEANGRLSGADHIERKRDKGFLSTFDRWWGQAMFPAPVTMEIGSVPPFHGGWFLYLGYELAREIEPTLDFPSAPGDFPIAFATRFPAAVIRDHESGEVTLVAETGQEDLLDKMESDLAALAQSPPPPFTDTPCLEGDLDEDPPPQHLENLRHCIDYIYAGDVFQVNLSRAWRGRLAPGLSHAHLYDRLRGCNPAPFAGLVTRGDDAIISSSPERLVEVRGRIIQTRPIAGTRPRGSSGITDVALSEELLAHPKERAEHIMLVDLERNDISRVCKPGSVRVDEMMVVESYAHVHHIVSNVRGELARAVPPGEVVRAVFPGGTITGCPKVRCMEILAELEGVGRGPYTGSMGYVNRDGSLDLNILIRTMLREGDAVSLRAGGGIVADSDPEKELEETRDKAKGVVRALTAGTTAGA